MKRLIYLKIVGCILFFTVLAGNNDVFAQTTITPTKDSLQEVEILRAGSLTLKTISDTIKLTIMVGNVKLKQGNSLFYCDSCVMNNNTNVFEAWGNVHINDADTADIYAKHLRYLARTKMAYLDGGVKLTDGKAELTTPDLEYDMERHIGIYTKGGKVINGKSVLTSQEGWYYADMKDVYFKKNVVLKDPAYNIVTDSLIYNSQTRTTRFISETTITDSSGRVIKTRDGYYNQQTGKAEFRQRPTITDGDMEIKGNNVSFNDSTGISLAEGNAIVVDKKNNTTIIAGIIFRNKNTDAILATRKPLMIIKQENDSIYISADTLFSARLTDLYRLQRSGIGDSASTVIDSVVNDTTVVSLINRSPGLPGDSLSRNISSNDTNAVQPIPTDSVVARNIDSVAVPVAKDSTAARDTANRAEPGRIQPTHGRLLGNRPVPPVPGATNRTPQDSTIVQTTNGAQVIAINEKDSTNRYFEAYRNVRIFNDSMQAVCDSLFYSFKDSVFRMYYDPIVWAKESQVTGDTINLFTKNKKADKFEAHDNSFLVNKLTDQAFNQIKSTRMDGYFVDGNLDSVRAKGFAECIYYIQDEDSAYTGINETKCDIMDVYFRNKELYKVVFRSAVTGTLWPIRDKGPEEMRLQNFRWLEERRPKTKLDMYE